MSNLDTQTKQFNIVITADKYKDKVTTFLPLLLDWFDSNCYFYAGILHDKDFNSKGIQKKLHYHFVLKCCSRYRISTMLYRIADILQLYTTDEISCISIDKCDSMPLSIQYLTHKNNTDKYHYNYDEIFTNFNSEELYEFYNSKADNEINAKTLTEYVKKGYTDFQIMQLIGLGRYHLYKGAIQDIRYALNTTPNLVDQFLNLVDNGEVK